MYTVPGGPVGLPPIVAEPLEQIVWSGPAFMTGGEFTFTVTVPVAVQSLESVTVTV